MRNKLHITLIKIIISTLISLPIFAQDNPKNDDLSKKSLLQSKLQQEKQIKENPFAITFYKPNYILPYNYTTRPYYSIYQNNTPDQQKIRHGEFVFQLSLKHPIVNHFFSQHASLYIAYTQKSFWQFYTKSAYFRETDYEPELFLSYNFQKNWLATFGIEHQSNGKGGDLERSWNRAYIDLAIGNDNWLISIKPWIVIFKDNASNIYNKDITDFLGYEKIILSTKLWHMTFSLALQNTIESGFKRGSETFTVDFPIHSKIKGFVKIFSGYGQNLIEYNHYTNAMGIGVSLSNWI